MVVPGKPDSYPDHPTGSDVWLVVEISDTTLRQDRQIKSALYARAGVPEYWILVLKSRVLEVRRDPAPTSDTGDSIYRSVQIFHAEATVTPLWAPGTVIGVAELLPGVEQPSSLE
jgi:Uma2 family endonuclease